MLQIPQIEISIRYKNGVKTSDLLQLSRSSDTADLCRQIFNSDTIAWTEEAVLICLNRQNKLLGYFKLSSGGTAGTMIDPKVVFTLALTVTAHQIILAHNHPSGVVKPSEQDKRITEKIKNGASLLDMQLLDHIIISPDDSYYSFADEGML